MGILLGNGTKLAPYLAKFTKVYWGEIALGLLTDTWDLLGKVKADLRAEAKNITLTSLKNAIATKLGTKLQQPPAYSALKIQGVPAYKRARRGEELNLSPREVTLYDCEVLDFTPPNLVFTARVGSGYYIRSLAYELGRELELPGGTLTKLTRLKIGPFSLEQALEPPLSRPEVADALISLRATLDFLPEYQVNFGEAKKFSQGQTLQLKSDPSLANLSPKSLEKTGESGSESDKVVVKVIDPSGKLLALGELLEYNTLDLNRSQGPFLRPLRVFQTGL
jgi:tRNA pseudouridine55 synthase